MKPTTYTGAKGGMIRLHNSNHVQGSVCKKKDLLNPKKLRVLGFEEHEFVTMDGFDDCAVGVIEQFGRPPIVCYDKHKVLDKLMAEGLTKEDAIEFWSFNQIGAWVGDRTPCFISLAK